MFETASTSTATPPKAADDTIIVTSTHSGGPATVVIVGGGGTGARVLPPLMQMLRRDDRVVIIDDDTVEERNLLRQHFNPVDIGSPKAQVLAARYRRFGIDITALTTRLSPDTLGAIAAEIAPARSTPYIIGCVDNPEARLMMLTLMQQLSGDTPGGATAYVDVGNETRGGQVLLNLYNWPTNAKSALKGALPAGRRNLNALRLAMPQLLRSQEWHCADCDIMNEAAATACAKCQQPQASCQDRIDLQTVQVNHMSAACALNAFATMRLCIPFTNAGAFFSTLNSMQPIKLIGTSPDGALLPDRSFADGEAPAPLPVPSMRYRTNAAIPTPTPMRGTTA